MSATQAETENSDDSSRRRRRRRKSSRRKSTRETHLRRSKTPDDLSSIQLHHSELEDPSEIDNLSVSSHPLETYSECDIEDDLSASQHSLQSEATSGASGLRQIIAPKETKNVTRWKTFVMLLLLVNAALVITATYEVMRRDQEEDFRQAFQRTATIVSDVSHYHAQSVVDAIESFSQTTTSYAIDAQVQWPFLTIPHFERRASTTRHDSSLEAIGFVPMVRKQEREAWEKYSSYKQSWIQDSYDTESQLQQKVGDLQWQLYQENLKEKDDNGVTPNQEHPMPIPTSIHAENNEILYGNANGLFAPIWQLSPPPLPGLTDVINLDLLSNAMFASMISSMNDTNRMVVSKVRCFTQYNSTLSTSYFGSEVNDKDVSSSKSARGPHSIIVSPIFDSFDETNRDMRALLIGVLSWEELISGLVPKEVKGIAAVVQNTCGQIMTFAVDGAQGTFLGYGDLHDDASDELQIHTSFIELSFNDGNSQRLSSVDNCEYDMTIYPSFEFRSQYINNRPVYFTLAIASIFVITGIAFVVFLWFSRNLQQKVMAVALNSNAVVSSLFPAPIRHRILQQAEDLALQKMERGDGKLRESNDTHPGTATTGILTDLGSQNTYAAQLPYSRPIADVFPDVTVMLADMVGFNSWSSTRDPTHVFTLLETVYNVFDADAKQKKVYKVETIGDCYVACAGLPFPQNDHAIIMSRFARNCLEAFESVVASLTRALGPDTGDLTLRVGLHSGAVTAGVLRGDRARYQVFGNTINVTSLMEKTCVPGQIQISQDTAEILASARKSSWFVPREGKIDAKAKGEIQTYWLQPKRQDKEDLSSDAASASTCTECHWFEFPEDLFGTAAGSDTIRAHLSKQNQRLAEWSSKQLLRLLNQVALHRTKQPVATCQNAAKCGATLADDGIQRWTGGNVSFVDEVKEYISMPDFDPLPFPSSTEDNTQVLSGVVEQQLHDFVSIVCSMYNENHLSNFQHASNSTMSLLKLFSRMGISCLSSGIGSESEIYNKSFGISADPMVHFGLAFATLIQDVDHPGVLNEQLVAEGSRLSRIYNNVSILEQNSISVGWDLLMDPMFDELRKTIYQTRDELDHFREIVINGVIATDIYNEAANKARDLRWEKAFYREKKADSACNTSTDLAGTSRKKQVNLKATLVIDCMMQASDFSSTMQSFHLFKKWNEKKFMEMRRAFSIGRAPFNPAELWYERQLNLFDNNIIPLAKKVHECGCFGDNSNEYYNNAKQNRRHWFLNGSGIVQEMEKQFAEKHNDKAPKTPSRGATGKLPVITPRRPVMRTHSHDEITLWNEETGAKVKRRQSTSDFAPRTPKRIQFQPDLEDPEKVVLEVFSRLPNFGRTETGGSAVSDDTPTVPRRSKSGGLEPSEDKKYMDAPLMIPRRSCDAHDLEADAQFIAAMVSHEDGMTSNPTPSRRQSDKKPLRPRRSCDSVSLAEDANAVLAMLPADVIDDEENNEPDDRTTLSASGSLFNMNGGTDDNRRRPDHVSHSSTTSICEASVMSAANNSSSSVTLTTDNLSLAAVSSDQSPKLPLRRRAGDNESSVRGSSSSPSLGSWHQISGRHYPEGDSLLLSSSSSGRSERDMLGNIIRSRQQPRLDNKSASNENTLLTIGNLWSEHESVASASTSYSDDGNGDDDVGDCFGNGISSDQRHGTGNQLDTRTHVKHDESGRKEQPKEAMADDSSFFNSKSKEFQASIQSAIADLDSGAVYQN